MPCRDGRQSDRNNAKEQKKDKTKKKKKRTEDVSETSGTIVNAPKFQL